MEIDNFEILMNHMDFVDPNDRYIVHIMRRPKDCAQLKNKLGSIKAIFILLTVLFLPICISADQLVLSFENDILMFLNDNDYKVNNLCYE